VEIPFSIGGGPQARHYTLIDTAGLRHIRREDVAVERYSIMRSEESIRRADIVVLMMDATEGPTRQDKRIASLIEEHKKGCIVLVNKWDLHEKITEKVYEKAVRAEMPFLSYAPLLFVSAKSGFNIRRSVEVLDQVAASTTMKLATGTLNRLLHDVVEKVQPPMVQGTRMKFFYAAQVGVRPVRIRLFVNNTTRVTNAYRQHMISRLRTAYGLEGAPVLLDFKSSHKSRAPEAE
jgi:GTP-binding protein